MFSLLIHVFFQGPQNSKSKSCLTQIDPQSHLKGHRVKYQRCAITHRFGLAVFFLFAQTPSFQSHLIKPEHRQRHVKLPGAVFSFSAIINPTRPARGRWWLKCLNFKAHGHFYPNAFCLTRRRHGGNTKVNRTNRRLVPLLWRRQLPSPLLSRSRLTASFPLPPHQPTAQKERDVLLAWVTLSFQPLAVLLLSIERSGSSGHSLICGVQRLSVESQWSERNEGAGNFWKRVGRFRERAEVLLLCLISLPN